MGAVVRPVSRATGDAGEAAARSKYVRDDSDVGPGGGQKGEERPSPHGERGHPKEGKKEWSQAAQAKAREAPPTPKGGVSNAAAKEKGGKGRKKKAWPSLPRTAAVAVNPLPGGVSSGAEFMKEAQSKLSLEEMGIPPWK